MPFLKKLKKKTEEAAKKGLDVGEKAAKKGVDLGKKGRKKGVELGKKGIKETKKAAKKNKEKTRIVTLCSRHCFSLFSVDLRANVKAYE